MESIDHYIGLSSDHLELAEKYARELDVEIQTRKDESPPVDGVRLRAEQGYVMRQTMVYCTNAIVNALLAVARGAQHG